MGRSFPLIFPFGFYIRFLVSRSHISFSFHVLCTNLKVQGLVFNNYLTDLPVKKGLSSSAAFCVSLVRAFNRIYDLKLSVKGEMDIAYRGEITTPSRCGRLDQCCAYGDTVVAIEFDGDR